MSYRDIIKKLDLKDMKLRRMDVCIKVMQRVVDGEYTFDMNSWQKDDGRPRHKTEKSLHTCGSPACFGGWLAISPEFKRAGGKMGGTGSPRFKGRYRGEAITGYLGLPFTGYGSTEFGDLVARDKVGNLYGNLYGDIKGKISARNVLTRLKYAKQIAIKQKSQS